MAVTEKSYLVTEYLSALEQELRNLNLWQAQPPCSEALASELPFAIDTLTLPQWLQFIFLPKMQQLVSEKMALPNACGIAPVAEEYFKTQSCDGRILIQHLNQLDCVLSGL